MPLAIDTNMAKASGRTTPKRVGWYQKAADQGLADGQAGLAIMYELGLGVPKDYAQAVAWFQKSADQGYARAQRNLGFSYRDGQGVEQDYVEAHKWLSLAAAGAVADLQSTYAENRDALANVMTPAQLAEARQRAAEWRVAFERRQSGKAAASLIAPAS